MKLKIKIIFPIGPLQVLLVIAIKNEIHCRIVTAYLLKVRF